MNFKNILILCVIIMANYGCQSYKNILDYTIINGGDRNLTATMSNNKVNNLGRTEAVTFFKTLDDKKYHYTATNALKINLIRSVPSSGLEDSPKEKEKDSSKFISMSVEKFTMSGDSMVTDYTLEKKEGVDSVPFIYYIKFTNVGSENISQIVFVDAISERFDIEKVYGTEGIWEIKEKEGVKFLIVKMNIADAPLKPYGTSFLKVCCNLRLK